MYQRRDGIVEFDPRQCIGCKACLQACPYDAIYIDPESHTAAKCHFCAHRTDIGLEPACVVVCPEHAIIAGDMDDPITEISRLLATEQVTVRKPEQGTVPKLFYIEGHAAAMHPTAVARAPQSFAFADVIPLHAAPPPDRRPPAQTSHARTQSAIRTPAAQGLGMGGPIFIGDGRMAEQMMQVHYNAQHKVPWHWPVPTYLVTKAIGAGVLVIYALGLLLGLFPFSAAAAVAVGGVALLFTTMTAGLLILDLERPERFFKIITRPQWRSWLTRGAFLLLGYSTLLALWWLLEVVAWLGWSGPALANAMRLPLLAMAALLAVGVACYTGFLFGQAEGRDLWQNPLLPVHLVVQALLAGSATILLLRLVVELPPAMAATARIALLALLVIDLFMLLAGEFGMPHATDAAARAAHAISHGRWRVHFWLGSVAVGHGLSFALALPTWPPAGALAGLCTLAGLYWYEHAYVMAPQEIPNS
jgi:formate-dependent nitrite reductase membrane component NrfD/ferredoxin